MKNLPKNDPGSKQKGAKRLARMVGALRDGDNFEKEKAMEQLIASSDGRVVELLIPLLQDGSTATRMVSLEVIKKMGLLNIHAVVTLLYDKNEDVRVYGCEVLAFLKAESTIPHLIRKVREDEENVRNTAVMALGEFNDDRAVDALIESLKDIDWIAFSAIYSLGKTGSPKAVPELFRLFKDGEEEVSVAACEVLIGLNDGHVLDEIFEVLKGWSQKKRDEYLKIILEKGNEYIFMRLKKRIGKELFDHLLNCVRYENKRSIELLRLLAHFPRPEACDALLDTLKDMDPENDGYGEVLDLFVSLQEVWKKSLSTYMKRDEEECLIPFIKACSMAQIHVSEALLLDTFLSSSANVRRVIVQHLPVVSGGNSEGLLRKALLDIDGHVRGDTVAVIGDLGFQGYNDDLARISREDYIDVRVKALRSLIKLDVKLALDLIHRFVASGTNEDKKVYLATAGKLDNNTNLPLVKLLLNDGDETVRRAAVGVIGDFLEDSRYVDLVRDLLGGEDILHEVLKVVKERGLIEFKERLIEVFMDHEKGLWTRYYALLALGAFGDRSLFEILLKGLEDENNLIKIGSLKALSDLEDARALAYVEPFVLSPDEDIRSAAEFVMSRLHQF